MNANELRIGNLVTSMLFGDARVTGINCGTYVCVVYFSKDGEKHCASHLCVPITLTPEILDMCGFELFPWGWVKKSSKDFGVRINLYSYNYEVSGNSPVKLENLHQLQNLYFALTGEELKINL